MPTSRTIPLTLLLSCMLAASLSHAADSPADEVVVEATRTNLTRLGEQITIAQQKVYTEYNKLNTVRDYAITCEKVNNNNSRFTKTLCQPVFKTNAEARDAQVFMLGLVGTMGGSEMGAGLAHALIEQAKPGYQKNMVKIASESPEMQKLLVEHAKLVKQYNDMYYKLNGDPKAK